MNNDLKHSRNVLILGLVSLFIFGVIHYNNDYMEYRDRKCVILGKMIIPGSYKRSGRCELSLKDEKGRIFDLPVTSSTYMMANTGKVIHFSLRDHDIHQTEKDNIIYFFGEAIFVVLGTVMSLLGIVWYWSQKRKVARL